MRSLPAALQKALRCVASSSFGLSAPRLVRGNNVEEKAKLVIASREINEPGETETHEISYEARDAARRVHRALHSRMSERVLVPKPETIPIRAREPKSYNKLVGARSRLYRSRFLRVESFGSNLFASGWPNT